MLSQMLFGKYICTVLTSATLTSGSIGEPVEKYRYFLDALGFPFDKGLISEPKRSPCDYDRNTILYISPNMPYPKHELAERKKYANSAIEEIVKLLAVTKGKALILFTARHDMEYVFGKLSNIGLPYKMMIQSENSSQKRRLNKFKTDTDSVILGTGTYWEGVPCRPEVLRWCKRIPSDMGIIFLGRCLKETVGILEIDLEAVSFKLSGDYIVAVILVGSDLCRCRHGVHSRNSVPSR